MATLRMHVRASVILLLAALPLFAQAKKDTAFVVGQKTATDGLIKPFERTHVTLSDNGLSLESQRQLVRMLLAEQGFAERPLPMGPPGVTLVANGALKPGPDEMAKRLYNGIAADQGDRVQVSDIQFTADTIVLDLNGGPYPKHRYLRHFEVNGMRVAGDPYERATGARIVLQFEGGVPELTAAEVKLLLEPVLNFGVKSSNQAFADTLPAQVRLAIEDHTVLVGMNRRMVTAARGQPKTKMRERDEASGQIVEEWIYGEAPEPTCFVRLKGDRVTQVKIAALGKPVEIHTTDELAGYRPAQPTRVIHLGDASDQGGDTVSKQGPPSLRTDAERTEAGQPSTSRPAAPAKAPASSKAPDADASRHLVM